MNHQNEFNKSYSGVEKLFDTELGMPNYNLNIVRKIQKEFGNSKNKKNNPKILDFGAGVGTLAKIFNESWSIKVECVEIDPIQRVELSRIGLINFPSLKACNKKYEYIYSSNVLEHIEDDLLALKELYETLHQGGVLVIYVPALPFLFSNFDESVGHFRRYTKKSLEKKISQVGFSYFKSEYCDSIGILGSLIVKYFGYDEVLGQNKVLLRIYDKYIFPISRVLDIFLKKFIGKNLLVICVK